MNAFSPDSVPSRGESEARDVRSARDWRTFRTVLLTVAVPVLAMLGLLVWAVARLGGGL